MSATNRPGSGASRRPPASTGVAARARSTTAHASTLLLERWHATGSAFYCAFACIYWLPGLPSGILGQVKVAAFVVLVALAAPRMRRPSRSAGTLFALLAIAAIDAFFAVLRTSDVGGAINRSRDFIEPLLWICALDSLGQAGRRVFVNRLTLFLTIFLGFAIYPILASYKIVPDFAVPAEFFTQFGSRYSAFVGFSRVSNAGFSGAATGWGPPTAYATLLLAACVIARYRLRLLPMLVLLVGGYGVAVIGARGASLALIIAALAWILFVRGSRLVGGAIVMFFSIGSAMVDWRELLPARFFKDASSSDLLSRLNYISTGRITTYVSGFSQFLSSPILGVGVAQATITLNGEALQVHNVWLRAAAEGGLLLLVPVLGLGALFINLLVSPRQTGADNLPNCRPVLLAGLMISMFEPSVIFGAFNNNVLFWTAIWFLLQERGAILRHANLPASNSLRWRRAGQPPQGSVPAIRPGA